MTTATVLHAVLDFADISRALMTATDYADPLPDTLTHALYAGLAGFGDVSLTVADHAALTAFCERRPNVGNLAAQFSPRVVRLDWHDPA